MSTLLHVVPALGASDDDKDDRWTSPELFAELQAEHHFTIDVAASAMNAKCARYFDREIDGLLQSWAGEVAFCNPPYSQLPAWVEKAFSEVAAGCAKVVMLLPANRTEQAWWQDWIEPVRDRGIGVRTRFLRGRSRFGSVANPRGKAGCPFGSVVVVVEARA